MALFGLSDEAVRYICTAAGVVGVAFCGVVVLALDYWYWSRK